MTNAQILKRIIARKGEYPAVAAESGVTYWQLVNFALGRTINPKIDVWNALNKWARKQS